MCIYIYIYIYIYIVRVGVRIRFVLGLIACNFAKSIVIIIQILHVAVCIQLGYQ